MLIVPFFLSHATPSCFATSQTGGPNGGAWGWPSRLAKMSERLSVAFRVQSAETGGNLNVIFPKVIFQQGLTLQGINISHLGKRKIIFKMPFLGDMLVPRRVPLVTWFQFGLATKEVNHLALFARITWVSCFVSDSCWWFEYSFLEFSG